MSIAIEDAVHGGAPVVAVAGELDIRTAPELRHHLSGLLDAGVDEVIVDLRDVSFVDSTALSVFVTAHKRLTATEGRLSLVCPDGPVRRVLMVTGLTRVLHVFPSLDAVTSS